jgi:DNA polymerase V
MSFPSPASNYVEKKLSLDGLCSTNAPYVYLIRAQSESQVEMIMAGAVLVVNSGIKPKDGSIFTASIDGEFRLVRFRNVPTLHLEGLDTPGRPLPYSNAELAALGTIFALVWLRMS